MYNKKIKLYKSNLKQQIKTYENENKETKLLIMDKHLGEDFLNSLIRSLPKNKNFTIDIILNVRGGSSEITTAFIKLLKLYKAFRTFVPYMACSAGTYISLCSNSLFLGELAVLSPCDTLSPIVGKRYQLDTISSANDFINKSSSESKRTNEKKDSILFMAGLDVSRAKQYETDVEHKLYNLQYQKESKVKEAFILNTKYTHDILYTASDCKSLGVVFNSLPEPVEKIYNLKYKLSKYKFKIKQLQKEKHDDDTDENTEFSSSSDDEELNTSLNNNKNRQISDESDFDSTL